MNTSRGFTIVELLITMTVVAILMTLAVVNLRSTQLQARDTERKSDVEAMAQRLDTLYTRGYPAATGSIRGSYPTTVHIATDATRNAIFKELPKGVMIDPLKETATQSIFVATNQAISPTAVTPALGSAHPYVYQPIAEDGSLCTNAATQTCRKFNFYYWTETGDPVRVESQYR